MLEACGGISGGCLVKPLLHPVQEKSTEAAMGTLKNQGHHSKGFLSHRFLDSYNLLL